MEAVWKRILLLIILGLIVTMVSFPIVRGEEENMQDPEGSEEYTLKRPVQYLFVTFSILSWRSLFSGLRRIFFAAFISFILM